LETGRSEAQLEEAVGELVGAGQHAIEDAAGFGAVGAGAAEDVRRVGADGGFVAAGFQHGGGVGGIGDEFKSHGVRRG